MTRTLALLVLLSLSVASCSQGGVAPTPANSIPPIATLSPSPSASPSPTPTPTPTPVPPTPTPAPLTISNISDFRQVAHLSRGSILGVAWTADSRSLNIVTPRGLYTINATTTEEESFVPIERSGSSTIPLTLLSADGEVFGVYRYCAFELWSAPSQEHIATIDHPDCSNPLAQLSPDGHLLATADKKETTIWVWAIPSGELLYTLRGHSGGGPRVAFTPDSLTLVSIDQAGTLLTWDMRTGERISAASLGSDPTGGHGIGASDPSISSDGTLLAVSLWAKGETILFDIPGNRKLAAFEGADGATISPAGDILVTMQIIWSADSPTYSVSVDSVDNQELLYELALGSSYVSSLLFSPDGQALAVVGDSTVRLFSTSDGTTLATVGGFLGDASSMQFHPDGNSLWVGSGSTIRSWDTTNWSEKAEWDVGMNWRLAGGFSISPDGRMLATTQGRTMGLWDTDSHASLPDAGEAPCPYKPAFSPDGRFLVGDCRDNRLSVWRTDTWSQQYLQTVHHLSFPNAGSLAIAFHPTAPMLAEAAYDGKVGVYDLDTLRTVASFSGLQREVHDVEFSPDGTMLAALGWAEDGTKEIRVWQTATWTLLNQFSYSPQWGARLTFSRDSHLLLVLLPGSIECRDTETFEVVHVLSWPGPNPYTIAWSADGRYLATDDDGISIWSVIPLE